MYFAFQSNVKSTNSTTFFFAGASPKYSISPSLSFSVAEAVRLIERPSSTDSALTKAFSTLRSNGIDSSSGFTYAYHSLSFLVSRHP
ncbi:hypothetical protein BCR33DRAFT_534375 [Rhizoclosmatium globosum]|uniref:Uncharacterized protein n=1 Tax=Rhizoclosmatium globosum TaxID=329046 RepID=A0A1Y2BC26_9FUNG|nr:hypothetical protein BCR33DRAFT_534375 [Rhizoclosmatium globosum]|eukprot:ORY32383.1 hypothetical protein BCR33DRAFT_534375 [Rhizoclosmatium globosum]